MKKEELVALGIELGISEDAEELKNMHFQKLKKLIADAQEPSEEPSDEPSDEPSEEHSLEYSGTPSGNKIYSIKSNLRHNGRIFKIGDTINADKELAQKLKRTGVI